MKAVFLFFIGVTNGALCAAAQAGGAPATQRVHCVMSGAEQAVVVAYFNTSALSKHLLGFPHRATALGNTTQAPYNLDLDLANLQLAANGRAIPPEARADFVRKERKDCDVGKLSGLRDVDIISGADDMSSQVFHIRNDKHTLLVRVSRVGFNKEGTIAVMHVSYYTRRSGGGSLYVFERKAGRWLLRTQVDTWTT